jgi:hypothetical protein
LILSRQRAPTAVKASFYFGLIEGLMLLATSRKSVELLRKEQPKDSSDCE